MEYEVREPKEDVEQRKGIIVQRIREGLDFKKEFPHWKEVTREVIEDTIAQTYSECLGLLNLEPADKFFYLEEKFEGELVTKMVGLPFEFKFSRGYLDTIAQDCERLGGLLSEDFLSDLRHSVAHETYHQREQLMFPRRSKRMGDKKTGEIKSETLYFRSERAADLFALGYIRHRKTTGFRQKISKLIDVIRNRLVMVF